MKWQLYLRYRSGDKEETLNQKYGSRGAAKTMLNAHLDIGGVLEFEIAAPDGHVTDYWCVDDHKATQTESN